MRGGSDAITAHVAIVARGARRRHSAGWRRLLAMDIIDRIRGLLGRTPSGAEYGAATTGAVVAATSGGDDARDADEGADSGGTDGAESAGGSGGGDRGGGGADGGGGS
jgi:hypothetical protein